MNLDATLTATEASMSSLRVTRDALYQWKARGLIAPVGYRGRSPLYRWGDLLAAERDTRNQTGKSHRYAA